MESHTGQTKQWSYYMLVSYSDRKRRANLILKRRAGLGTFVLAELWFRSFGPLSGGKEADEDNGQAVAEVGGGGRGACQR